MKLLVATLWLFLPIMAWSQQEVSLDDCLETAMRNHPRVEDRRYLENISENNLANLNSNWKPELNINGQVTYQSDAIQIDAEIPGIEFPSSPKDQYKLYLDVRQTLFDGGRVKQSKKIEDISNRSEIKSLEAEIDKRKGEIIDIYFNVLLLQENLKIQDIMLDQLKENKSVVSSAFSNGIVLETDLRLIEIEILNSTQEMAKLNYQKKALMEVLSNKCGMEITQDTNLLFGELSLSESELGRKELEALEMKKQVLEASSSLKDKTRLPVLFAFGQLGYGNPGLNMLRDEFDTYYYLGAGVKWNLWDWNDTKRDKDNLLCQSHLIDNRIKEFEENINNALITQLSIIRSHQDQLENLSNILDKRSEIVKIYSLQLEEGTIKTLDYLTVINQERIAKIKLVNESIAMQKAIANYNYLKGVI